VTDSQGRRTSPGQGGSWPVENLGLREWAPIIDDCGGEKIIEKHNEADVKNYPCRVKGKNLWRGGRVDGKTGKQMRRGEPTVGLGRGFRKAFFVRAGCCPSGLREIAWRGEKNCEGLCTRRGGSCGKDTEGVGGLQSTYSLDHALKGGRGGRGFERRSGKENLVHRELISRKTPEL